MPRYSTLLRSRRERSLVMDLRLSFRLVGGGVATVVIVLALLAGALLGHLHPGLRHDTDVTRGMRIAHEAMVDQESGLTGWLATGDDDYLALAEAAREQVDASSLVLAELLGGRSGLDRAILDLRLAQQTWTQRWADEVRDLDPAGIDGSQRRELLRQGRVLFDDYRAVHESAIEEAASQRDLALDRERTALVLGLAATFVATLLVGLLSHWSRRRLTTSVVGPVHELRDAMDALAGGGSPSLETFTGPTELRELAEGLEQASRQLHRDRTALVLEQERTERAATVLRSILDVAREIAGSLNVRYVAETLTSAANRIAGVTRTVVWLSDGQALVAVHDSSLARGAAPEIPPVAVGDGGVGLAARDARPALVSGDHPGWAFPLVVGGRVVGVLELTDAPIDLVEELIEPLETLAIHGAAALEAARLNHKSQELAQVDALTQLSNRRRLDADLEVELERSRRYGRPLGFILLDVDHFKVLNDTYGHLHGDEVLRLLAETLAGRVRGSDTVYRYGGEEFAVLVREGGERDAEQLAERLRVAIEQAFTGEQGVAKVTASFGVAAVPAAGCSAQDLVGAADRALYAAKHGGRNRVEVGAVGPVLAG